MAEDGINFRYHHTFKTSWVRCALIMGLGLSDGFVLQENLKIKTDQIACKVLEDIMQNSPEHPATNGRQHPMD